MSKDFNEFQTFFNETKKDEVIKFAIETIRKHIKESSDENGKISSENQVVAIAAALVQISAEFSLKTLESYHHWRESNE